jgi:hypothetical protein
MPTGFEKLEQELPRKLPSLIPDGDRREYELYLRNLERRGYSKAQISRFILAFREWRLNLTVRKGLTQSAAADSDSPEIAACDSSNRKGRGRSGSRNGSKNATRHPKRHHFQIPHTAYTDVSRLVQVLDRVRDFLSGGVETSAVYRLALERSRQPQKDRGRELGKRTAHNPRDVRRWIADLIQLLETEDRKKISGKASKSATQVATVYAKGLKMKLIQRPPGYRFLLEQVRKNPETAHLASARERPKKHRN